MAFRNSKTRRHSEIKQTRPSTKQDFSGEALSEQNTEASLASLSCNSSRAPTEWSAIFAFGVFRVMPCSLHFCINKDSSACCDYQIYCTETFGNIFLITLLIWSTFQWLTVLLKVFQHHRKTWIIRLFFRWKAGKWCRWITFRNWRWRRRRRYNRFKYTTTWRSSHHLKRQHGGTALQQRSCQEL